MIEQFYLNVTCDINMNLFLITSNLKCTLEFNFNCNKGMWHIQTNKIHHWKA